MNETVRPHRIVVMGVAGSGRTAVGSALAARLGLPFADAGDFHPPANVAKMRAGRTLDDPDRVPWLHALGEWLAEHTGGGVVSCSALKVDYRDLLRAHAPDVTFLHLAGDAGVVTARVDQFMPASLVCSQLELLEPLWADEAGMVADLTRSLDELVGELSTLFRGSAAAVATGGTR